MRSKFLLVVSFVLFALFAAACGTQATPAAETEGMVTTDVPTIPVVDLATLMDALRTAGVTVETGEAVEQVFFTVPGEIIKVNGADVQVFVYETAEAMEAEAAQVAEDGGSIGTNMVAWVEAPHFYKAGRMLVLYVGEDPAVQSVLEGILGPQFAGR